MAIPPPYLIVPTTEAPSQLITITLAGQDCVIGFFTKSTNVPVWDPGEIPTDPTPRYENVNPCFITLWVNGGTTLIIGSIIVRNNTLIVRDTYLGFLGDLVVYDFSGAGADPFGVPARLPPPNLRNQYQLTNFPVAWGDRAPASLAGRIPGMGSRFQMLYYPVGTYTPGYPPPPAPPQPSPSPPSPSTNLPRAVHFDGTTNGIYRTSPLSGVVAGPLGVVSFWANMAINPSLTPGIFTAVTTLTADSALPSSNALSSVSPVYILFGSDGPFVIVAFDAAGSSSFEYDSPDPGPDYYDGNWHHFLAAWNTTFSEGSQLQMVIDGVLITTSNPGTGSGFNIAYDCLGSFLGTEGWDYSTDANLGGCPLDLTEFYLNTAEWLDLTVSANVAKFRNPITGKPANLYGNGAGPTGSQPAIYLSEPPTGVAGQFAINQGYGGNFAISGVLARATTDPF